MVMCVFILNIVVQLQVYPYQYHNRKEAKPFHWSTVVFLGIKPLSSVYS